VRSLLGRLHTHRTELAAAAAELDELFRRHLAPEEDIFFPALRRHVDAPALAAMRAEMRARR